MTEKYSHIAESKKQFSVNPQTEQENKEVEETKTKPHTARVGDKLYNVDLLIEESQKLPDTAMPTEKFDGFKNGNFWIDREGNPIGPHTLLDLIDSPGTQDWEALAEKYPQYKKDILKTGRADYSYPILVAEDDLVVDGMHRLTKGWIEGLEEIGVKKFDALPDSAIIPENEDSVENEIEPIHTEVPLTEKINIELDCGPHAFEMALMADGIIGNDVDNVRLREACGKESDQGTMPGNLVKAMVEAGYDEIIYISAVDWNSCTDAENVENWDRVLDPMKGRLNTDGTTGTIPVDKFAEAAQWLTKNSELVEKVEPNTPPDIDRIADSLREGYRVITLVKSDHWVVVTGVDKNRVYFNNPVEDDGPKKESMTHKEFQDWTLQGLGTPEMIIAKKK